MCHSLAFDQLGGTIRTLRHGSPAQVIADLRALYRAGGPERPAELGAGARGRPGDVAQIRAAVQFARARASLGARADQAIRGGLLARAAPASTATRWCSRRRARSTTGSGRSPSRPATCCTAGSITAPTRSSSGPASRGSKARRPARAATSRQRSNRRDRSAAARSRHLPHLPWRRDRRACRWPRPARCATISTWTAARRRCCSGSGCAAGAGRRP